MKMNSSRMSIAGDGKTTTIYKPSSGKFIGDVDLHFDADKLLFSSFRDKSGIERRPGHGQGLRVSSN